MIRVPSGIWVVLTLGNILQKADFERGRVGIPIGSHENVVDFNNLLAHCDFTIRPFWKQLVAFRDRLQGVILIFFLSLDAYKVTVLMHVCDVIPGVCFPLQVAQAIWLCL